MEQNDPNNKSEMTNNKYDQNQKPASGKPYELEERTYRFARRVRDWIKTIPMTLGNVEDGIQVIRASGSIGANYIEANGSLGNKDFLMHIRICRKEARESRYWLRLMDSGGRPDPEVERQRLIQEAHELSLILGAILRNRRRTILGMMAGVVLALGFVICCLSILPASRP